MREHSKQLFSLANNSFLDCSKITHLGEGTIGTVIRFTGVLPERARPIEHATTNTSYKILHENNQCTLFKIYINVWSVEYVATRHNSYHALQQMHPMKYYEKKTNVFVWMFCLHRLLKVLPFYFVECIFLMPVKPEPRKKQGKGGKSPARISVPKLPYWEGTQ